jgi:hypothetical protein
MLMPLIFYPVMLFFDLTFCVKHFLENKYHVPVKPQRCLLLGKEKLFCTPFCKRVTLMPLMFFTSNATFLLTLSVQHFLD